MIRKLTNIKDVAFGEFIRLGDDEQETISPHQMLVFRVTRTSATNYIRLL